MSPYLKKGERTYTLTLATGDRAKPYARLTSGTRDKATADAMQAMLEVIGLRGKRWHWIHEALLAMPRRLTVARCFDAYVSGALDDLREQLADLDLRPLVTQWDGSLARAIADGTMAEETVRKYRAQVRVLAGESAPLWRSTLTAPELKRRLEAIGGSGTNRRRHAAAWTSVLDYCVEHGALEANPMRTLKLPKSNRTQLRYAEWPHVVRLLHAMPAGMHRAAAAMRHGFGLEMQALLPMTRADVDLATKVVWAHGRKNTHRDRQAIALDDACWAIVADYVRTGGFLPEARLFPMTHKAHARVQHEACAALRTEGVPIRAGYTLHAARHSCGVEMKRRGFESTLLASNFGHADTTLVDKLYAKFAPRTEDLVRARQRAEGAGR